MRYLDAIQRTQADSEFPSPTSQPSRVVKTSRARLERETRKGLPGGHTSLLFYMGSDDAHDFFYFAHHTYGRFYGVARDQYPDLPRMPLTADSLSWRVVPLDTEQPAPTTNPSP